MRYTRPLDPLDALMRFRRKPGNYVLYGRRQAYPGRQGPGVDRLGQHLRRVRGIVAVQFMTDHADDPCVRAGREEHAYDTLPELGWELANEIRPSVPTGCRPRRRRST